jgi:hypothetical protein
MIIRRDESRKEDDITDMCKLLLSFDPSKIPTFVARELTRIPCTADAYDVTKVEKELQELKRVIEVLAYKQNLCLVLYMISCCRRRSSLIMWMAPHKWTVPFPRPPLVPMHLHSTPLLLHPWQHQKRGRRSGQQPMRQNEGLQQGQRQNVCIGRAKCQGLRGIEERE